MAADPVGLPSNIFVLKGDAFYHFLETTFSSDIKELARMQGFSSARSLLHSRHNLLDFLRIESDDADLIAMKKLAAFRDGTGTWTVKAGIEYEVNCLISSIGQIERDQTTARSEGSILVSTDILSRFLWLRTLIEFCQNCSVSEDRDDLNFLSSFIENIANNLMKSSHHNRYTHVVEQFAFALYVLGGRQAYEFVRLNLPGSLPSMSTLSILFNEKREQLAEGQFRFDSMKTHLRSLNTAYAFVSEDCTGVIQKVSYDRRSNSFVGFCPPLQNNGFPRLAPFQIETFSDLETAFKNKKISSLLNIHSVQPITPQGQRASPFLIAAYGTDNTFDSYHLLRRWLQIFDESLQQGIRVVGFATDCDARYLRTMRLVTNFFSSLPNFDLRTRADVFELKLPTNWNWFYLDPVQLFVVFQVKTFGDVSRKEQL